MKHPHSPIFKTQVRKVEHKAENRIALAETVQLNPPISTT